MADSPKKPDTDPVLAIMALLIVILVAAGFFARGEDPAPEPSPLEEATRAGAWRR